MVRYDTSPDLYAYGYISTDVETLWLDGWMDGWLLWLDDYAADFFYFSLGDCAHEYFHNAATM